MLFGDKLLFMVFSVCLRVLSGCLCCFAIAVWVVVVLTYLMGLVVFVVLLGSCLVYWISV